MQNTKAHPHSSLTWLIYCTPAKSTINATHIERTLHCQPAPLRSPWPLHITLNLNVTFRCCSKKERKNCNCKRGFHPPLLPIYAQHQPTPWHNGCLALFKNHKGSRMPLYHYKKNPFASLQRHSIFKCWCFSSSHFSSLKVPRHWSSS